ncbi:hypothetical protein [Phenylobacterium sp.]|nr:hypothetical protein [Phenylobacterium sp.]
MEEVLSVVIALAALAGPSVLLLAGFALHARAGRKRAAEGEADAG